MYLSVKTNRSTFINLSVRIIKHFLFEGIFGKLIWKIILADFLIKITNKEQQEKILLLAFTLQS